MRANFSKSTLSSSLTGVSKADDRFECCRIISRSFVNTCYNASPPIRILGDCSFYAKYLFQAMFGDRLARNGGFITFGDYAQALSSLLRGSVERKIE